MRIPFPPEPSQQDADIPGDGRIRDYSAGFHKLVESEPGPFLLVHSQVGPVPKLFHNGVDKSSPWRPFFTETAPIGTFCDCLRRSYPQGRAPNVHPCTMSG